MSLSKLFQNKSCLIGDLTAGFSVALMVIPQGIAYANLAGLPSYSGLYAAALPLVVAAFFASSRYLQTGPVAMTSLLTYGALTQMSTPGTADYVQLALLLAVIVGIIRLAMGLLKAGAVTYLMSQPVIIGFSTAAALLIIASQFPVTVGVSDYPGDIFAGFNEAITSPRDWNWQTIALSLVTLLVAEVARRLNPLVPGVLIAVLLGLVIGSYTGYTGALVGDVPEGFPPIDFNLPWAEAIHLIVPGLIIGVIGFAEPAAISRILATKNRERWSPNKELISQGLANIAAGFSGGFPIGGSFARSTVNQMAGARTRWSGAITGLVVLGFTPFASFISNLPRAVLGIIVITSVARVLRFKEMIKLVKVSWGQAMIAWVTFVAAIFLAPRIDLAVMIGVAMALFVHVFRESSRLIVHSEYKEPVLTLYPSGVLFYASAPALSTTLERLLVDHPEASRVIVDLRHMGRIDFSGMLALQSFAVEVRLAGMEITAANIPQHARGIWHRVGGLDRGIQEFE